MSASPSFRVLSTIAVVTALSAGPAAAQTDNAAQAAQSAASAASSAESARKSAAAAEAAAAKFDLPVNISVGDRIRLKSNLGGLTPLFGASGQRATVGTCLRVTRLNDGGITFAVEEGDTLGKCDKPQGTGSVQVGDVYQVAGDQLKNASYARYGWVYGPMVVPFKYFPHDRSFEPSQSLGMYVGYRTSWFESRGLSWVASAGLATMKVSQVVDDPSNPGQKIAKDNTVAGYSLAFGPMFDLTREAKPFVAGLLVGWDFVGRNSALTYVHDRRPWLALQVGWVQ